MIYSVFVVNRHGGLIFQKAFIESEDENNLNLNSAMQQGSTFFVLSQMAQQVSPVEHSSGIESIEFDDFVVECLAVQTGLHFMCVADQTHQGIRDFLRRVYVLYVDYVGKNPFSLPDQPIKADKFELYLGDLVREQNTLPPSRTGW